MLSLQLSIITVVCSLYYHTCITVKATGKLFIITTATILYNKKVPFSEPQAVHVISRLYAGIIHNIKVLVNFSLKIINFLLDTFYTP